MQGKRLPDNEYPEHPGEYSRIDTEKRGKVWYAHCPHPDISCGSLELHTVIENEDKTITVTPSIFFNKNHPELPKWHGHLTNGIWEEC